MFVGWHCAVVCVPCVDALPSNGGGVAVGWYPVGMWLLVGLGVPFVSFLHTLLLWLFLLQWLQNTLIMHSCLMLPCSLHLKHVGPFLLLDEFGESSKNPLQPVILVVWGWKVVCVGALVSLLVFHTSLRPVALVALIIYCPVGSVLAPWIIESFTGGLY